MEKNVHLREPFARASTLNEKKIESLTEEERLRMRAISGLKNVKRNLLGLCGFSTIKSLDEVSSVLMDVGIAGNYEEGVSFVEELYCLMDGVGYSFYRNLVFEGVGDAEGQEAVRIYLKDMDSSP